ncbi:MAG: calycin-like domain-containing protein [Firmicutes bacterium]|nr:calycin-like domain-containing protein [Bacillota bacterium]
MKKIYLSLSALALLSGSAMAQQLPNAGFEGAWNSCSPWTGGETKAIGTTPESWTISHVAGYKLLFLVWMGATQVGEKTTGNGSESAVLLKNSPNSIIKTQTVPGYITLGTPWNTANTSGDDKDGGSWGGIDFTYRPDALSFDYIRTQASGSTEQATVVAYSWKGTWTQASVPASIGGDPNMVDMTNRDRNILGIETAKGGDVTHSDDAALISKINYALNDNNTDWKNLVIDFEYSSTATPTSLNVIFGAGNYFSTEPEVNNALTIDNVKLVYYSRLSGITVNGTAVEGFASDTYSYNVDATLPEANAIVATVLGNSGTAKATVAVDQASNTATITVANAQGADLDGKTSHVYTLTFKAAATAEPSGATVKYPGTLDVSMLGSDIAVGQEAEVNITPYSDGTYTLVLPNFSLALIEGEAPAQLGDIVVPGVKVEGSNPINYSGSVKNFSLLGGEIIADIDLTGTEDANGKIDLDINVMWGQIPIAVKFNGQKEASTGSDITYRRIYTDNSSRYYSEISYKVGDETTVVYSTTSPTSESYYVTPKMNAWQEEGAYIDMTDKVIKVPADAQTFTMILKGISGTAINRSQNCVYVDWNNNGSFIDEGETNGVINRNIKPNAPGGGLVITETGDRDEITLPANVEQGMTFPVLLALTEPYDVSTSTDRWNDHWEWSTEIFADNVCSLINGQAYGLTLEIVEPASAAIDNVAADHSNAPVEFFNLQGISVDADNLVPGIYIMRQGNTTKKVLVK